MSVPSVSTLRPNSVAAYAVRNARITPEPVPISRTRGVDVVGGGAVGGLGGFWEGSGGFVEGDLKRAFRKAISEVEDSVSRRR